MLSTSTDNVPLLSHAMLGMHAACVKLGTHNASGSSWYVPAGNWQARGFCCCVQLHCCPCSCYLCSMTPALRALTFRHHPSQPLIFQTPPPSTAYQPPLAANPDLRCW